MVFVESNCHDFIINMFNSSMYVLFYQYNFLGHLSHSIEARFQVGGWGGGHNHIICLSLDFGHGTQVTFKAWSMGYGTQVSF